MKLEGSFFHIIDVNPELSVIAAGSTARASEAMPQTASGSSCYRIRLNPDHIIYKAHFPEQPITPGVIIVRIAVELLGVSLGRKVRLVAAPNVKFSAPLFPIDPASSAENAADTAPATECNVEIALREDNTASVTVSGQDCIYSKMLLKYE